MVMIKTSCPTPPTPTTHTAYIRGSEAVNVCGRPRLNPNSTRLAERLRPNSLQMAHMLQWIRVLVRPWRQTHHPLHPLLRPPPLPGPSAPSAADLCVPNSINSGSIGASPHVRRLAGWRWRKVKSSEMGSCWCLSEVGEGLGEGLGVEGWGCRAYGEPSNSEAGQVCGIYVTGCLKTWVFLGLMRPGQGDDGLTSLLPRDVDADAQRCAALSEEFVQRTRPCHILAVKHLPGPDMTQEAAVKPSRTTLASVKEGELDSWWEDRDAAVRGGERNWSQTMQWMLFIQNLVRQSGNFQVTCLVYVSNIES